MLRLPEIGSHVVYATVISRASATAATSIAQSPPMAVL